MGWWRVADQRERVERGETREEARDELVEDLADGGWKMRQLGPTIRSDGPEDANVQTFKTESEAD